MRRQKLAEAQQQQAQYANGQRDGQQSNQGGQQDGGANPWGPIGAGQQPGYAMGGFGAGGYGMQMPQGAQQGYQQGYTGGAGGAPGTGNPY